MDAEFRQEQIVTLSFSVGRWEGGFCWGRGRIQGGLTLKFGPPSTSFVSYLLRERKTFLQSQWKIFT